MHRVHDGDVIAGAEFAQCLADLGEACAKALAPVRCHQYQAPVAVQFRQRCLATVGKLRLAVQTGNNVSITVLPVTAMPASGSPSAKRFCRACSVGAGASAR